ncbi:MAG: hypothetical protein IJ760_01015 [Bacteroidales bacterium]|nr:hypothetical protein [Bacteroidales bacterium]
MSTQQNEQGLMVLDGAKEQFALAMREAQSLDIVNNVAGAFETALVVNKLEAVLTDDVMKAVFMPLMNKKIGFLTDRDPNKPNKSGVRPTPYSIDTVRTAIIDAAAIGLLPTGNQFNIISGSMYPAKAGFTALLGKMKHSMGLAYSFEFDPETQVKSADPSYVAIPCRISYKTNRDDLKGWFRYVAMVKSNGETSTTDQLRGKAERKCKKAFVEFLTGMDLGEGDAETVDVSYTEVSSNAGAAPAPAQSASQKARELLERAKAKKESDGAMQPPTPPQPKPSPADAPAPAPMEQPEAEQPADNPQMKIGGIQ